MSETYPRSPRARRLYAYGKTLPRAHRRVAYLGWLNHGNMGDEAVLAAYGQAFPNCIFVEIPQRLTQLRGPLSRLATTRGVVLGGGTLIGKTAYRQGFERLLSITPHAPAVMLGTGVEDPAFHRSQEARMQEELQRWAGILPQFSEVSVRGPLSQELLQTIGIDCNVVGDSALLLGPHDLSPASDARVLGLNLSLTMEMWGGRPDRVFEAVSGALRPLVEAGWRIRYIPLWPADLPSAYELQRVLGQEIEIVNNFHQLPELMRAIGGCRIFVGQKLHSVILASAMHVPSIMIEYHPKCRDFQRSVKRDKWTIRTDTITAARLRAMLEELENEHDRQRADLFATVRVLRAKLVASADRARSTLPRKLQ